MNLIITWCACCFCGMATDEGEIYCKWCKNPPHKAPCQHWRPERPLKAEGKEAP